MNKHIIKFLKIFIVGIIILNTVSCSDFLDKNPLDQISSQTFWNTEKEADMALAGVYSR
jgi:starch-binding outer membrane protein, SusD/RagB family